MSNLRKDLTADRPVVYILSTGSPNAAQATVRGVFGDSRAASDGCADLINRGISAQISVASVSAPGIVDDDVWLHAGVGSTSFTAFGSMDGAEARRAAVGGSVRAYPVQGWAGRKAVASGNLCKALTGTMQDYPIDYDDDPAMRETVYGAGFAKHVTAAFQNPKSLFTLGRR